MQLFIFGVFYTAIGFLNLKTPGREEAESTEESSVRTGSVSEKAVHVLAALGGAGNIHSLEACITRLRLEVNNINAVDNAQLKKLGASGVLKAGANGVQVVFGVESDLLKEQIKSLMNGTATAAVNSNPKAAVTSSTSLSTSIDSNLVSPLQGEVVRLEEVPDPTFSQKMMGEGMAIRPTEGRMLSPCDGEVMNLFPTGHAIGILGPHGAEILIHIGLDTVKMKGDGFKALVKTGDQIRKGQPLIEFSIDKIKQAGFETVTPIVVTNSDQYRLQLMAAPQSHILFGAPALTLEPQG